MKSVLKIAIQKKGRLHNSSINLIKETGIKVINGSEKLISSAANFPIEFLYLRDDDIPMYVNNGIADIGIVGENEILEKRVKLKVIEKLGFAKCRMSLAVPKKSNYIDLSFFSNKRIATSYPNILKKYLKENNIKAKIHKISGSVEIAPGIGSADAIFDIVSTGSTLISNGLKEVDIIRQSEAVLVGKKILKKKKAKILEDLLFRVRAVRRANRNKYILLNSPNDKIDIITKILPGIKSPTILPLAEKGWSSLHSVVNENDFWEVIGNLKKNGAQGILVIPIEKMIV